MAASVIAADRLRPLLERAIFSRHGRTAYNLEHRLQGSLDTPLADEGFGDAAAMAAALPAEWNGAVFTSPLQRAVRTAGIIAGRRGLGEPVALPDLREMDYGDWEGQRLPELDAQSTRATWFAGPLSASQNGLPPKGEDFVGFLGRVNAALEHIAGSDGPCLVITHATTSRAIVFLTYLSSQGVSSLTAEALQPHEGRFFQDRKIPHQPFRVFFESATFRTL